MAGYFEDLWRMKALDIAVPSFGHLSDLFASLPLHVRYHCDKVAACLQRGEPVSMIMDSSGFRFDKASHWYETKYITNLVIRSLGESFICIWTLAWKLTPWN